MPGIFGNSGAPKETGDRAEPPKEGDRLSHAAKANQVNESGNKLISNERGREALGFSVTNLNVRDILKANAARNSGSAFELVEGDQVIANSRKQQGKEPTSQFDQPQPQAKPEKLTNPDTTPRAKSDDVSAWDALMAKAIEAEAKGQTKELPPPIGINTGQISNLAARFKDTFGPYNEALKDCAPGDRQIIKGMVADKLAGKFDPPQPQEAGMMTIRAQDEPEQSSVVGVPTITGADGTVYMQGHVSNVPEVSHGVQNLDDLKALGGGVAKGLQHIGQEGLKYMSQKDAVNDSLLQIGPALDNAVNYYGNTPAEQVGRDARVAIDYAGQALEHNLGHPLKPEQRGEYAAAAMPMFMIPGRGGRMIELSEQSGIEVTTATGTAGESIWPKGWSVRGFEAEGEMGSSGVLSRNFPTIDDGVFKDGVFTSMKSIDLNAPTYQNMEKLEKRLNSYLEKMSDWQGQRRPWGEHAISPSEVRERVLNIGIPNGSMTEEQAKIFEQIGKRAQELGVKVKLTVIE